MKLNHIHFAAAFLISGIMAQAQISHTGLYQGKTSNLAQDVINAFYTEFIENESSVVEELATDWDTDMAGTNFIEVLEGVYGDIDALGTPGEQQAAIDAFVNDADYFNANGEWVGDSATNNLTPVVANVTAMQVEGTKNMEIFYDLSVADNHPCTITVQWSTDNGATYPLTASAVTGEAGPGISPGVGKSIIWDMAVDWDNQFTQTGRIKIIASREVIIDTGSSSDTGDNSPTGD